MTDQTPPTTPRSRRAVPVQLSFRMIVAIVLAIVLLIFSLQNLEQVNVNVLFWDFRMRLAWALLLFALIGVVIGWVVPKFRSTRHRQ